MPIDRGSVTPPWRQVAADLQARIDGGEFPPGSRIPSILRLAEEYAVSPVTVRKALDALKDAGVLEATSGWGTHVTRSP